MEADRRWDLPTIHYTLPEAGRRGSPTAAAPGESANFPHEVTAPRR
jgi:hypothetical protein